MIYTIKIISFTKYILISLFLIIIFICLSIFIFISIGHFNEILEIIGFIISFIIIILFSILFSQKNLKINLDKDIIELNGRKISLLEINGFFISKVNPIATTIALKTISNNIELTAHNFGKSGKVFKSFISELLEKAAKANPNFIELSYYDLHPSQRKAEKTFSRILIVLASVFPFVYLYLIYFKGVKFVWQIFLVNILYIAILARRKHDL